MTSLCYLYRLTDAYNGMWYIGARTARGCSPKDLGVSYFTSSLYVGPLFRECPSRFEIEILLTSDDPDWICRKECELLVSLDAKSDKTSYNCSNGSPEFNARKCSELLWQKPSHQQFMRAVHKELAQTEGRKKQLEYAKEQASKPEAIAKIGATHRALSKTPKRKAQLERARAAAHTPEAEGRRSMTMKKVYEANPEKVGAGLSLGAQAHFDRLKTDPEYAKHYSDQLKKGWVKRKARRESE